MEKNDKRTNQREHDEHPLYKALQQLAVDLKTLFSLATEKDERSWNEYIAMARKEIESVHAGASPAGEKERLYRALVLEVYDHLTLLIHTLKSNQEEYRKLATRDLLTGVYNRNYFNEVIVRDIERAKRHGEQLSFILLDVNGFKLINDTYGHLYGDGVLRACADILRKSVRKADFLCRYGGDEFVIVTSRTTCEENAPLFKRIERNLDEWNRQYEALDFRLSFSLGCAVWSKGKDVLDVLHEADQAMYEDKKRRKGR
ncbi:MAG: GGDEF domain-containing protein [Nitrospiraceae bacterium]|nr:GGDEF domain-containing protein [Nitrospiraceae bacterium]